MVQWHVMSAHGPTVRAGQMLKFPDGRIWVVEHVNKSRAYVHPLTPEEKSITVPSRADYKKKVIKEINDYGEPMNISVNTCLPLIELGDLPDLEYRRLMMLIDKGVDIPLE